MAWHPVIEVRLAKASDVAALEDENARLRRERDYLRSQYMNECEITLTWIVTAMCASGSIGAGITLFITRSCARATILGKSLKLSRIPAFRIGA